jgi:Holliday junction resolvase-like predicted endonuclease
MSKMSRTKGQVGEREVALELSRLTGQCIRRRVRNAAGDSDLEGLSGWSVEVKRHRSASRSDLHTWWDQVVRQAQGLRPLLVYRQNRDEWLAAQKEASSKQGYEHTLESSLSTWAQLNWEQEQGDG